MIQQVIFYGINAGFLIQEGTLYGVIKDLCDSYLRKQCTVG
jgi:hypothetical protein